MDDFGLGGYGFGPGLLGEGDGAEEEDFGAGRGGHGEGGGLDTVLMPERIEGFDVNWLVTFFRSVFDVVVRLFKDVCPVLDPLKCAGQERYSTEGAFFLCRIWQSSSTQYR